MCQTDLVMFKELKKEGGHSRSDSYEEVDDYQEHIGCTGNLKPEGCWVHDGSDGPPARRSIYDEQTLIANKKEKCVCVGVTSHPYRRNRESTAGKFVWDV